MTLEGVQTILQRMGRTLKEVSPDSFAVLEEVNHRLMQDFVALAPEPGIKEQWQKTMLAILKSRSEPGTMQDLNERLSLFRDFAIRVNLITRVPKQSKRAFPV